MQAATMENGRTIKFMALGRSNGPPVLILRGSLDMAPRMAKEHLYGMMANHIKESSKMEIYKGMAHSSGQAVKNILENIK